MSRVAKVVLGAGLGAILLMASERASLAQGNPGYFACQPYSCSCIATQPTSHDGFGGPRGNIGIQIRAIDPRVVRIRLMSAYTNQVFYLGRPVVGQFIRVPARMVTIAFAPRVGLGCAVHYWVIDHTGRVRG